VCTLVNDPTSSPIPTSTIDFREPLKARHTGEI
jgi:hypothetical protein